MTKTETVVENGNVTGRIDRIEGHNGYWENREYNENGKLTSSYDSNGFWEKREYKGGVFSHEYGRN